MNPTKNSDPKPALSLVGIGLNGEFVIMRLSDGKYFSWGRSFACRYRTANEAAEAMAVIMARRSTIDITSYWTHQLEKPKPQPDPTYSLTFTRNEMRILTELVARTRGCLPTFSLFEKLLKGMPDFQHRAQNFDTIDLSYLKL